MAGPINTHVVRRELGQGGPVPVTGDRGSQFSFPICDDAVLVAMGLDRKIREDRTLARVNDGLDGESGRRALIIDAPIEEGSPGAVRPFFPNRNIMPEGGRLGASP
jgi:hypothetical protein